jgi:hypothetical protein
MTPKNIKNFIRVKYMKKSFCYLLFKIFILIVIPFIFSFALMNEFPLRFFDGEYSLYQQNKDYSYNHDEYCRVLIMGDSTSKAAWLPTLLTQDTYNFALGGASTVEEYYYLKEYLINNDAPKYLIYTANAYSMSVFPTLWNRSVYFHRITFDDLEDLINNSKNFSDGEYLIQKDGKDIEMFERVLYYIYSPTKYGTALVKGLFSYNRYKYNYITYQNVVENRGQTTFGTAIYCDELNRLVEYDGFEAPEMFDYYLQEIIKLCDEYNIKFIFQNPPMNKASFEVLNENFIAEFEGYLLQLQVIYPNALIDEKLFCYGNEYFGDKTHLNINGTEKFTLEMKEKYSYIFTEE